MKKSGCPTVIISLLVIFSLCSCEANSDLLYDFPYKGWEASVAEAFEYSGLPRSDFDFIFNCEPIYIGKKQKLTKSSYIFPFDDSEISPDLIGEYVSTYFSFHFYETEFNDASFYEYFEKVNSLSNDLFIFKKFSFEFPKSTFEYSYHPILTCEENLRYSIRFELIYSVNNLHIYFHSIQQVCY